MTQGDRRGTRLSPSALWSGLRPSHDEIVELALRETDPREVDRFEPITRGPAWALVALILVGLASIPASVWRLCRGLWRAWRER